MQLLVLYDSVEGQTKKIAEFIASQLDSKGMEVFLTQASDPTFCDPAQYDAAILCAPVHIGAYPTAFVAFIQNWKSSLNTVPTAFVSVSLAITSKDKKDVAEAQSYPKDLFSKTGWSADRTHHAAGALRYLEYDFFKRWMMKKIAASKGEPTDTTQDYELTDWDQLKEFVESFVDFAQHEPKG